MNGTFPLLKLEKLIIDDPRFLFTIVSYVCIVAIYINLNTIKSSVAGIVFFIVYFFINGIFLADAFLEKEDFLFRLLFGVLLFIMLLGFVGFCVMVIYNLDLLEFTLVLFIVSTISSLMNKRMKNQNVA